jgi:hypothetical protein
MGMKTRTNFTHRIDMWDYAGENIIKHLRVSRIMRLRKRPYQP